MGIIEQGTCGTCVWELDDKMTLTIRPQDGKSGVLQTKNSSSWPWQPYCHIRKVIVKEGVKTGTYASKMFAGMRDCTEFDVSALDVSAATNMRHMFSWCRSLTNVKGTGKWDTSKIGDMSYMFSGCSSLRDVSSLKNWNVSQVIDISCMFNGCSLLEDITGLEKWNVSNVADMSYIFSGCGSLKNISALAKWNVSGATDMSDMFECCRSLADTFALAEWNVSEVTDMSGMFNGCVSLADVSGLKKWNVSGVIETSCMFYSCASLKDISCLSEWDMSNVCYATAMFYGTDISDDMFDTFAPMTCPKTGAFIGYKGCHGGRIVQLEVPEDAKRSSAFGRKCRCSRAKVLNIWTLDGKEVENAVSVHDRSFVYRKGEFVEVLKFDEDRFNECSSGIHFFMTREEAEAYIP